jgi:hypothetical protein
MAVAFVIALPRSSPYFHATRTLLSDRGEARRKTRTHAKCICHGNFHLKTSLCTTEGQVIAPPQTHPRSKNPVRPPITLTPPPFGSWLIGVSEEHFTRPESRRHSPFDPLPEARSPPAPVSGPRTTHSSRRHNENCTYKACLDAGFPPRACAAPGSISRRPTRPVVSAPISG